MGNIPETPTVLALSLLHIWASPEVSSAITPRLETWLLQHVCVWNASTEQREQSEFFFIWPDYFNRLAAFTTVPAESQSAGAAAPSVLVQLHRHSSLVEEVVLLSTGGLLTLQKWVKFTTSQIHNVIPGSASACHNGLIFILKWKCFIYHIWHYIHYSRLIKVY